MPHSQEPSNNPYPIPHIDTYFFKVHSNIVLPKGIFPAGAPVKILKALLPSSIFFFQIIKIKMSTFCPESFKLYIKISMVFHSSTKAVLTVYLWESSGI